MSTILSQEEEMAVEINTAIGKGWDTIGEILRLNDREDASGARRMVVALIMSRNDQEAIKALGCTLEEYDVLKNKLVQECGPIPSQP
jgi:hypothetical protein